MKKTKEFPTQQGIYQLLQYEWNMPSYGRQSKKAPLQELGVSPLDVNWLLYSIEQQYNVEIKEENISLRLSLEEFVHLVLKSGQN